MIVRIVAVDPEVLEPLEHTDMEKAASVNRLRQLQVTITDPACSKNLLGPTHRGKTALIKSSIGSQVGLYVTRRYHSGNFASGSQCCKRIRSVEESYSKCRCTSAPQQGTIDPIRWQ